MLHGFEQNVHFSYMYVLNVFTKMDTYKVKCVTDYDKYIRQRMASYFIILWNPDLLLATWMRLFVAARKDSGLATMRSLTKVKDAGATTSPSKPVKSFCAFSGTQGTAVEMVGEHYVKEGCEHKVDAHHLQELSLRQVVLIPVEFVLATHGKWQSASDALAMVRPRYFMIKVNIKSAHS
ncbi:hypothetical protein CYMTET_6129 [Cymbomonas tetramitiformis]|uniref:Uncharacterized protein n=1 Tax=Cymbomonas tetramitiformis TaxID=36881 RepID=A0AAE0LID5_9CHLO|nr:hypothetical protein CYMTET_6129 [Cymbomonas tetramitiformis]